MWIRHSQSLIFRRKFKDYLIKVMHIVQKELGYMQKAKLTSSISRIFISLALHSFGLWANICAETCDRK